MSVEVGSKVQGKVTGITNFGAFVELPDGSTGLVHISEVADSYVKDINDHLKVGDLVRTLANRDGVFEKIAGNFYETHANTPTEMVGRRGGGRQRRQDERLRVDAGGLEDSATSKDETDGDEASRERTY